MRLISRHVTSVNRTVQICPGISTMESPDLSSPGLPILRFPIPEMGNLMTRGLRQSDGSDLSSGFSPWKIPNSRHQDSRVHDSRFPEMGNLMTRGLRQSDGPDLSRGFHHGKSRSLVTRTPEFAIPDFPKWVISRHVASVKSRVQIYFGDFSPIHWGLTLG
jgi:hypothetical protein